ncbi:mycofactocin biosynthesis chaperone MftB [Acidimicrobiaceae bacterium USS-CC1]|uniref:Mycofactocin biosynthesis chaperone MftB n=1 Tax=Acidiferrimicrobium australe TaxID=2664430 RepID=A0ABW9QPQ7_9ACTN|nr:mycofactocin biosynthesis chaperone MftB [Acidiferrimicrobium australe]
MLETVLTDDRLSDLPPFDPGRRWRLAPSVAVRPEPFGALVYNFANRRLSFLKSEDLRRVVESLAEHPSAESALGACGVGEGRRPAYVRALADLARSGMLEPVPPDPPPATANGAVGGPR